MTNLIRRVVSLVVQPCGERHRGNHEWGLRRSIWHNPFPVGRLGRQRAIDRFKDYLARSVTLWTLLRSLKSHWRP